MPTMLEHMHALGRESGWDQLAAQKEQAVWRVALEDDLDAVFFTLANRLAVMRGVVADLPSAPGERDAIIQKAAQLQVAFVREHASVLSFEPAQQSMLPDASDDICDRLICFRTVPLETPSDVFIAHVQDWLNEYAWWKSSLTGAANSAADTVSFSDLFSGIRI